MEQLEKVKRSKTGRGRSLIRGYPQRFECIGSDVMETKGCRHEIRGSCREDQSSNIAFPTCLTIKVI